MIKQKFFLFCLAISASSLIATPPLTDLSFEQNYPETVVINNRILLKIDDKAITILDVVRKMDLLFYRQYPELASSPMARYQFYMSGWRSVLWAVIDDYLIVADAKEKEVIVNDGEVREELEKIFGPDVVLNLDNLGLTLDEAFELLKTELTVQRMTGMLVRSKALTEVNPAMVRKRYGKMLSDNPPQDYLIYRVLSFRGDDRQRAAEEAHRLISEQKIPFEEIASHIQTDNVEITYSEEYRQKERDLSLSYKAALKTLSAGMASAPVNSEKVSRLFCLKGIEKVGPAPFNEIEDEIKKQLMQDAMVRYNVEYRNKLRKNFGLTERYLSNVIPKDIQPFALK